MFDLPVDGLGLGAWLTNALVLSATVAVLVLLQRPAMRRSEAWRATVTQLASIIGSGFLVVAPLLGFAVGEFAFVAMAAIIALAYLVGQAIRYNIQYVEPLSEGEDVDGFEEGVFRWMGRGAKLALAAAYVIAVTFYLELLGAFVLRPFDVPGSGLQKWIASALILSIGGFGLWRGLRVLERLETWAVEVKLSIIAGFLIGLLVYNGDLIVEGRWALPAMSTGFGVHTARELMGAFLIVQGFETSRYLRGVYSPEQRIRTMRYAQWIAAAIYLVFVGLATVLLDVFDSVSETGIIDLSSQVAFVLPILLVLGAAMSQFSAAVADTIGSGGLVEEVSEEKVPRRLTYAAVAGLALALLWTADIFEVIAYASRAFALYYTIQCAMASLHATGRWGGPARPGRAVLFGALTLAMLATAWFGIPAETGHS
jgi:hypothetical protein